MNNFISLLSITIQSCCDTHHNCNLLHLPKTSEVMLTCARLSQYSLDCPPQDPLQRSVCVQQKYDRFLNNPDNKSGFVEKIKLQLHRQRYIFCENTFPYKTERGIEHWVCWYKSSEDPFTIIEQLKEHYHIITSWRNIPKNRSILDIDHIHVFIDISYMK